MLTRAEAEVLMHDALTGVPQRVDGKTTGSAVADAFVLLERDEIHVDYLLVGPGVAQELRDNPDVGMGETLWGAIPVESAAVPGRTLVVCGHDGHGPRTALAVW